MHSRRAIWVGLLLTATLPAYCQAALRVVNGFAAIVNKKVITFQDVILQVSPNDLEMARLRFGDNPRQYDQEVSRLRQDALVGLIETELILSEFETAGYQLPESLVEERIKDRIREQYGDRVRLMRTLQAENSTFETFHERVREQIIVMAMTDKNVSSAVLISPYKIQKYYEDHLDQFQLKDRVRLKMISLWNRVDRGPAETRALARDLAEQLKGGASFTELASENSDDRMRSEGGNRGWIELGGTDLRSDLQDFAFSLEPGVPSEPLEKDEGCYLMLVEEAQRAHTRPLSEVRREIEAILRQKERAQLREKWINRLRDKSFIRWFPLG